MGAFSTYFWGPYVRGVRTYRILNDTDYNLASAREELQEKFGWKDYGGKHHESRFTRFFQAHYLPEKFGFDKRKAHLSSLIAAGQISRGEACDELSKAIYDEARLSSDREYFLKKLRFSEGDWESIMQEPPRQHEDLPNLLKFERLRTKMKEGLEGRGIKVRRNR